MTRPVWIIVASITAVRACVAYALPLTGDEAYYWEWSRRPAFGYVDHPPMVAWTIAAFSWLGQSPGSVRLGFVLCGAVATVALAAAASRLARDARAGVVAALAFSLAPLLSLAFGSASPDGPFLAFWCLSLAAAARLLDERDAARTGAWLGVVLAGSLLSRVFGFALVAGTALAEGLPRGVGRRGLWLALGLAAAGFAPVVWWNATHQWATLAFSLGGRHVAEPLSPMRVLGLYAIALAAFSPGIFVAALVCAVRPQRPLLAWTALPLLLAITVLAFKERVEVYWLEGPFASLCVALGTAFVNLAPRVRAAWSTAGVLPALVLLPALFVAAILPGPTYAALHERGLTLRHAGPFEIYTFPALARDVKRIVGNDPHTIVMTDGYGFSSLLDYNARITPVVIGYDAQGKESRRWYSSTNRPQRALFVDKEDLYRDPGRPDFARRFALACASVRPGPTLVEPSYPGVPDRPYYTTWCDGLVPGALRILRWEDAS